MKKQRHRRKPHTCVLCKEEETYDWNYICSTCKRAWRRGYSWQRAEDARMPEGIIEANISWYWYLYEFAGDPDKDTSETRRIISKGLLDLVGARQMGRFGPSSGWAIGHPKGHRGSISQSRYILNGNERTLELLQAIYEAICDLLADAYQKGERRGKSFVTDLAEGKLTVEDLQRL